MGHIFAGPMFEQELTLFGLPVPAIAMLVGGAGLVVSFLVVRRLAAGEGEYRSFRATRWRDPSTTLTRWVAVAVAFGALVAVGVVLAVQPR